MSPSPLPALGPPVVATPHGAPESARAMAPDPEFDALVAQHARTEPKAPDHPKAPAHPKAPHRADAATKRGGPDSHDRPTDKDQSGAVDRQDDSAGQPPGQPAAVTIGQLAAAAGATSAQPSASGDATLTPTPASDAATRPSARTVAASVTAPTSASAGASAGSDQMLEGARQAPTAAQGVTTRQAPGLGPKVGTTGEDLAVQGHPAPAAATAKKGAAGAPGAQAGGVSGPSAAAAALGIAGTPSDVPHDRVTRRGEGSAPAGDTQGNATTPASLPTAGIPTGAAQHANAGAGTGSTGPATSQPALGGSIPAQVQPTLARLVSRGDGTHRMSLQLHPADLGEVRVTVTVKNGSVDVSLAAAPAAQDALRDGSVQLRSLLSSSGHTLDRLVVQDLPAAAIASGQPGTGQGGLGQQAPQHGSSPAPAQTQSQQTVQGQAFGSPGQDPGHHPGQQAGQQGPGDDWSGGHPAGQHPAASRAAEEPHRTLVNPSSSTRGGRSGLDLRI